LNETLIIIPQIQLLNHSGHRQMNESNTIDSAGQQRMQGYLEKIAAGPRMSKDLTEEEAEDALSLILHGSVSPVRSGVFLIAARMKLETVPEILGYWRALDKTTVRHTLPFDRLLQVADPFDGFNRLPYFGFYTLPVISALGLPVYGHSSGPQPPKRGTTFEKLLRDHYGVGNTRYEDRLALLQKFGFGFLSTEHCNPALHGLDPLRVEIVKRPILATLEKMLMPVSVKTGGNFLASGYFHKGYEVAMMQVAKISAFDTTIVGNGAEGTTLYGVHKSARIWTQSGNKEPGERKIDIQALLDEKTAGTITETYENFKNQPYDLAQLAEWGESALANGTGPAAPLIACQAATLGHLFGLFADAQECYNAALEILQKGKCKENLTAYIDELKV
jgi:anthranilate phosphoribosyltransferase